MKTDPSSSFRHDFAPLERTLKRALARSSTVMTPERMIVELSLTPQSVAEIEKRFDIQLRWFGPAYAAMKKHDLLPVTRSWDDWLIRYEQRRDALRK